jgi:hypothetical protein
MAFLPNLSFARFGELGDTLPTAYKAIQSEQDNHAWSRRHIRAEQTLPIRTFS